MASETALLVDGLAKVYADGTARSTRKPSACERLSPPAVGSDPPVTSPLLTSETCGEAAPPPPRCDTHVRAQGT
jgi:hypothetical protein